MSLILSNDRLNRAEKYWKVLQQKLKPLFVNDTELKECIDVVNETIFRTDGTDVDDGDIAVNAVSNEDFVSIMNEIDSEMKSNEQKSGDNEAFERHKDTKRMTFITAPVCKLYTIINQLVLSLCKKCGLLFLCFSSLLQSIGNIFV